ncbi:transporter [Pseudomonas sp. MAFF 301451]|nr:transporter [Pseudomonas cyclaminis]
MHREIKSFAVSCALILGLFIANANSTENGLSNYPVGVSTAFNGLLPAPGQSYFYNYAQYYKAESFRDSDGKKTIPKFSAELIVDAPRVVHTWNEPLGPFSLSTGVIVPLLHVSSTVYGQKEIKKCYRRRDRPSTNDRLFKPFA